MSDKSVYAACGKCAETIIVAVATTFESVYLSKGEGLDLVYCKTCFQAAVDHVTEVEKGLAELQEMVDRQSSNLELWRCGPYSPSIPEGQRLQAALHELHALVERVTGAYEYTKPSVTLPGHTRATARLYWALRHLVEQYDLSRGIQLIPSELFERARTALVAVGESDESK